MAEADPDLSIVWSARLELGDLENDAGKAQALIDKLFERNANRTIDVRLRSDGGDEAGSALLANPRSPGGNDVAAGIPGIGIRGDINQPLVTHVDTTEVDSAIAKFQQLIGLQTRFVASSIDTAGRGGILTDAGLGAAPSMAGDGPTGSFSAPSWVPAGFKKREIERKLLAAYESQGGGYTADDEARLEAATQGAGDPFTFSGEKLPGEVRTYLQGAPREVRSLFRLARPGQRSGGPEAMAELGEEEYFSIAERIAGTPLRSAIAAAENSEDPEIQFLSDYYKNLPTRGAGRRGRSESVAPVDLQTGETFTIGGRPHTITEPDEEDRRLTNEAGLDVPLAGLRKLPIDEGSRRRSVSPDLGDAPLSAPRLTPSEASRVFTPTMGAEEELQTPSAGGGQPPLQPPSSRTFNFDDEPSTGFSSRLGRGGSPSLRPETPQEARGMTRRDLDEPLPEATVLPIPGEEEEEGGGRSSFFGRGWGRRFTGGIIAYEALRVGEGLRRYGRESSLAGRDPLEQLRAEQTLQTTVAGVPFIGQAADLLADSIAESQGTGRFDTELAVRRAAAIDKQTDILSRIGAGDVEAGRRAGIALAVDPSERARREAQATFDQANEARLVERRAQEAVAAESKRLADIETETRADNLERDSAAGGTEAVDSPGAVTDFGRAAGLEANRVSYQQSINAALRGLQAAIAAQQDVRNRTLDDINFARDQALRGTGIETDVLRGEAEGRPTRDIERQERAAQNEQALRPIRRRLGLALKPNGPSDAQSQQYYDVEAELRAERDRQSAEHGAAERGYALDDRRARDAVATDVGSLSFRATGDVAGLQRFRTGRSAYLRIQEAISSGKSLPDILAAIQSGGAAIIGNELDRGLEAGRANLSLAGESNVLNAELGRDPFGAQTARIEAERASAIEVARARGILTPDVERGIDRNAFDRSALAWQQFSDRRALVQQGIAGQLESSRLQEGGSFQSAQVADIANAFLQQAAGFRQQGFEEEAQSVLELGQSRLRGFKRNFTRSFRGEGEQDKFGANITSPDTGYEQVTDVFAEIQKKQGELTDATTTPTNPLDTGGSNGSGQGGPTNSQVDTLTQLLTQVLAVLTGT